MCSTVAINCCFKLFHTLQLRERAVIASGGATSQSPVVNSLGLKIFQELHTSYPHHCLSSTALEQPLYNTG